MAEQDRHLLLQKMKPDLLPPLPALRRKAQSLAMLDAILSPEWAYRCHSFNAQWAPGEAMASMRDGAGSEWFLFFDAAGAALKGFALARAGDLDLSQAIQRQVPPAFSSFLHEPAFSMQDATFCYWRQSDDAQWQQVEGAIQDDGSDEMLALLVSDPTAYKEWAEAYFECPVSLDAVTVLFAHQALDDALIAAINPSADAGSVHADAAEIGYPCLSA